MKNFSKPNSHSGCRGGGRKFPPKVTTKADLYDGVNPAIFSRLGIEMFKPPKNSRMRRDLVTKLVAAIKADTSIIEREEEESTMREEGFWRWAGRNAYYAMLQTRENIDWATGQKRGPPRRFRFDGESDRGEALEQITAVGGPATGVATVQEMVTETNATRRDEDDRVQVKGELYAEPKKKIHLTISLGKSCYVVKEVKSYLESLDPVEEGLEALGDMLIRYKQRLAGERTIGVAIALPTTPDGQHVTVLAN